MRLHCACACRWLWCRVCVGVVYLCALCLVSCECVCALPCVRSVVSAVACVLWVAVYYPDGGASNPAAQTPSRRHQQSKIKSKSTVDQLVNQLRLPSHWFLGSTQMGALRQTLPPHLDEDEVRRALLVCFPPQVVDAILGYRRILVHDYRGRRRIRRSPPRHIAKAPPPLPPSSPLGPSTRQ